MGIFLAWHNTVLNKKRTLAAAAGIAFSILLMFMQFGFLDTVKRAASLVYTSLNFDLMIASNNYEYFNEAGRFDRGYLVQALLVPGIDRAMALNMETGSWENPQTKVNSSIMLLGIELEPDFVLDPAIKSGLDSLKQTYTVMLDRLSHSDYGPLTTGRSARINRLDVSVASLFSLGQGFYADGAALVANHTFYSLMRRNPRQINFGLLLMAPGADATAAKAALKANLPAELVVFDKQELIDLEQNYFVSVMPLGIMIRVGVIVAFLVGAVILFQVLATEITNKLKEFATLKAVGFTPRYIYAVGFQQAMIYLAMSYLPSLVVAWVLFQLVHLASRLPIRMTAGLMGLVLLLSFAMCAISGMLALRKIKKADPADLF